MNFGAFPPGFARPETPEAVRFQLHSAVSQSVSRGVIAVGPKIHRKVNWESFNAEPTPVISSRITYYRPR